jgi:dipeptidyl-peptidase 4
MKRRCLACFVVCLMSFAMIAVAQERLAKLPGHANFERVRNGLRELGADGRIRDVEWSDDGATLSYRRQDKPFRVSLTDLSITSVDQPEEPKATEDRNGGPRRPRTTSQRAGRAEQSTWVRSPNGQWIARYRDYNVILEKVTEPQAGDGSEEPKEPQPAKDDSSTGANDKKMAEPETIPVTTSGSQFFRYGTACWVYGEELFQDSAMWWSPDSRLLAFYEIDERHMQDYYLTLDNVETFTKLQVERYPKAGTPNPYAGLLIYNLESKQTIRVDVGGDRLQYVYDVRFTPDGQELLFSRTNRAIHAGRPGTAVQPYQSPARHAGDHGRRSGNWPVSTGRH